MLVKHLHISAQHPTSRQKVPRQCPATARSGQSASWEGKRPGCSQHPGSWHHDQRILHCEKHTEAHTASLGGVKEDSETVVLYDQMLFVNTVLEH